MRTLVAVHRPRAVGSGLVLLPLLAVISIGSSFAIALQPAPVPQAAPVLAPAPSPFFIITFTYGTSAHMQQTIVVKAGGSIVRELPQRDHVLVMLPAATIVKQQEMLALLMANARVVSVKPFSDSP